MSIETAKYIKQNDRGADKLRDALQNVAEQIVATPSRFFLGGTAIGVKFNAPQKVMGLASSNRRSPVDRLSHIGMSLNIVA